MIWFVFVFLVGISVGADVSEALKERLSEEVGLPYTDSNTLKCFYEAIYTLIGNEPGASIENITREFIWIWVFEYKEPKYRCDEPDKFYFPPYFDSLLPVMMRIAPKVEIKITWPE